VTALATRMPTPNCEIVPSWCRKRQPADLEPESCARYPPAAMPRRCNGAFDRANARRPCANLHHRHRAECRHRWPQYHIPAIHKQPQCRGAARASRSRHFHGNIPPTARPLRTSSSYDLLRGSWNPSDARSSRLERRLRADCRADPQNPLPRIRFLSPEGAARDQACAPARAQGHPPRPNRARAAEARKVSFRQPLAGSAIPHTLSH